MRGGTKRAADCERTEARSRCVRAAWRSCTAQHGMYDLPHVALILKLQQIVRFDGRGRKRQQSLLLCFAIFRCRRWGLPYCSIHCSGLRDQPFFHSLAFLSVVGTSMLLVHSFHQLHSQRCRPTRWSVASRSEFAPATRNHLHYPFADTQLPCLACKLSCHAAFSEVGLLYHFFAHGSQLFNGRPRPPTSTSRPQ